VKPICLTMTAFGPYAGKEIIQFEALEAQHLFLITGPTGAGKTSIFDAISYALYGETSGEDRPENSIRCDNAPEDLLTEVTLVFELRGKLYTIERTPKQLKPKVRGEGYTEHAPEATLWCEGEERPVTGIVQVRKTVEDLLGLEINQFKQIMMIPQGEFRKLLMAKSDERATILKHIFKTHFFGTLQKTFSDEKLALKSHLDQFEKERTTAVSKLILPEIEASETSEEISEKNNVVLSSEADAPSDVKMTTVSALRALLNKAPYDYAMIQKYVQVLIDEDQQELKHSRTKLEALKQTLRATIESKSHAQMHNTKVDQLKKLKNNYEMLCEKADSMAMLEEEIHLIESAKRVLPYVAQYNENLSQLEKSKIDLENKQSQLNAAKERFETTSKAYEHVFDLKHQARIEALTERQLMLQRFGKQVNDAEAQKKRFHQEEENIKALKQTVEQRQDTLEQIKADIEMHEREIESLQSVPEKMAFVQHDMTMNEKQRVQCKEALEHYHTLEQTLTHYQALLKTYKNEQIKASTQEVIYLKCKQQYHLNQAAMLAETLQEGQPCPVCGAAHHPMKALYAYEKVSEETLKKEERIYQKAIENLGKSRMNVMTTQEKVSYQQTVLVKQLEALTIATEEIPILQTSDDIDDCDFDFEYLFSQLSSYGITPLENKMKDFKAEGKALLNQHHLLKAQGETLRHLKEALPNLKAQKNITEKALQEGRHDYQQATANLAKIEATYDALQKDIPEEMRSLSALEKALKKCVDEKTAILTEQTHVKEAYEKAQEKQTIATTALRASEEALTLVKEQVAKAKRALDDALTTQGLNHMEVYHVYKEKITELIEKQEKLATYKQQLHTTKEKIGILDLELEEKEQRPLEPIEDRITALKADEMSLETAINTLDYRIKHNQSQIVQFIEITQKMGKDEERYRVVGHLADIISGRNQKNITFERFILATYLKDILEVANIRLGKMTNQRYALRLSETLLDRRQGAGLDLEVMDSYTGMPRSVKTLSGGESFKASLAMALGLADVVQASSGGIQLDTVFIDEGFGTLDQESLDSAINCLIELQEAGRLVGIISHVQELKERIKTQLIVEADEQGSHTFFKIG